MQAIKGIARQIQGALPVVGLLSRLSSPSGGIGNDILVSPDSSDSASTSMHTLCASALGWGVSPHVGGMMSISDSLSPAEIS